MTDTQVRSLTARQRDALIILGGRPRSYRWAGSEFAALFWPGKKWRRGSNNYGLGPDGSGLAGGRMLSRLSALGLTASAYDGAASRYVLTGQGWRVAQALIAEEGDDDGTS